MLVFLYLYRHSNLVGPKTMVAVASEKQNREVTTIFVTGKAPVIMFGFCMLIVRGPSSTKV